MTFMPTPQRLRRLLSVLLVSVFAFSGAHAVGAAIDHSKQAALSVTEAPVFLAERVKNLKSELGTKFDDKTRRRLDRGLVQVTQFWRTGDGDAQVFDKFVRENFIADPQALDEIFNRLEFLFEQLDGHMNEIARDFRRQSDLDLGPILPIDELLAGYDPAAHLSDDFFQNRLAFIVLLNFPLTSLQERLDQSESWPRRQWAEARLAMRFSSRVPAQVNQELAKTRADAQQYIAEYNIWMHHLLDAQGERLFPAKLRLITHWNLRDELKANYSDPKGLPKQRMIQQVMEHIVSQTIPAAVINNPHLDWNPYTNQVIAAAVHDAETSVPANLKISNVPEPDTRYAMLLNTFKAVRRVDPYAPTAPTLIERKFNEDREIPEARVQQMFEQVLTSPQIAQVAKVIGARLGRPLEPFDIWYNGFRPRDKYTEAELDEMVSKRYPTAQAYAADIPRLLQNLGFTKERAEYLAAHIVVDPSRGAGHALGALRREDKAHLRTRVEKGGMNYKGFNIAVHELGHNVEQTFSLNNIDHTLLQGVPNSAFTEALAFVFQGHDLELLGLSKRDSTTKALGTLNDFWATYEIIGVALVDMRVWHWLYAHPDTTPAQLRDATIQISKEVWNQYYAPTFKKKDVVLLGIYSHMINETIYLPDYPIGHFIAFQIEEQMDKAGNLGTEFERMARIGRLAPDVWMKQATGAPVGPEPLLRATAKAIGTL